MSANPDGSIATAAASLPRHLAVVMDGNGRWAESRGLPRTAGHRAGVAAARRIVDDCGRRGIRHLTLFAFSSENWQRPHREVGVLMQLFVEALDKQVATLAEQGVRLRFIGALETLEPRVAELAQAAMERTADNDLLTLYIALAYGGRWDLVQAARGLAVDVRAGTLDPDAIDEAAFASRTALAGAPAPDLLLRTGGEHRISNFLLWDLAYAELYFCDTLWPDFDAADLDRALEWYGGRERRFGRTREQLSGVADVAD